MKFEQIQSRVAKLPAHAQLIHVDVHESTDYPLGSVKALIEFDTGDMLLTPVPHDGPLTADARSQIEFCIAALVSVQLGFRAALHA